MRLFILLCILATQYWQWVLAQCPNEVVGTLKNASRDFTCFRTCTFHPKCTGVWYRTANGLGLSPDGNCILWTGHDTGTFSSARKALGFLCWALNRHSPHLSKYVECPSIPTDETAMAMGFDLKLTLGIRTFFLKKLGGSMNPASAEAECFRQGGVLPMEDTEDFIEAMSKLLGDHTTPRLVSLVSEHVDRAPGDDIAWTLGPKEWGRDEDPSSCPRYSTWPQSHYNSRHFVVNPVSQTFEPAPFNLTRSNVHCQFLGRNLAQGKRTIVSSTQESQRHNKNMAVDGQVLDGKFWHGRDGSAVKPDWIAVDLEAAHAIHHVLFFTRQDHMGNRNMRVKFWVGSQAPLDGSNLNHNDFELCGIYSYRQGNSYMSGATCSNFVVGQYVVLENDRRGQSMAVGEIAIFGAEI